MNRIMLLVLVFIAIAMSWFYFFVEKKPIVIPVRKLKPEIVATQTLIIRVSDRAATETTAISETVVSEKKEPVRSEFINAHSALLKRLAKESATFSILRSPDFWLFRSYVFKQSWQKVRTLLRGALQRPQPVHFRFIFSWLLARVEMLLWIQKPERALFSEFSSAIEKLGKPLPDSLKIGEFIPGAGYFPVASLGSQSKNLVPMQIQTTSSMVASLTRELKIIASEPSLIPSWINSIQVYQAQRCQNITQIASLHREKIIFALSVPEVDFLYQAYRPIPPDGLVYTPQEKDEWMCEYEKSWFLAQIPACSGKPLFRSRKKWVCNEHLSVSSENAVQNKREIIFPMAEAWCEFLFCNPTLQPEMSF
ncbi:MAG: hypothetical protein HQM10_14905 [Candidatus Riflebacteria bacterium]|nr:hypothetical protein [Candidatus Riflebacteria bacterium]